MHLFGLEQSYNPGDVLETDAEEAERLIQLGAATAYVPAAEETDKDA